MSGSTLKSESAELVVLSVLAEGDSYGYAMTRGIAVRSEGEFRLGAGQLYPLLNRLEKNGLVETRWEEIKAPGSAPEAAGRRRKWYRITDKGRKRLDQRVASHRRLTALIESFLAPGSQQARA